MTHKAILLLGSNIDPAENIRQAIKLIREAFPIEGISSTWETVAIGRVDDPMFLNIAVAITTIMDAPTLKESSLTQIEKKLGRIRTDDKNSPRTIDIDLIIFDDQVMDPGLWAKVYVTIPVSELMPEFCHPITGMKLEEIARRLLPGSQAKIIPDLTF